MGSRIHPALGINCADPPLGRTLLYLRQRIKSFRFEDQRHARPIFKLNEEVRDVLVNLPIVQVRNPEPEPSIFHK